MITEASERATAAPRARGPVVGVVGGGQLARMSQHAASRLGIDVVVLDPDAGAPAVRAGAGHQPGLPTSLADLERLAARCDVITLDHEQVPFSILAALEDAGHHVAPSARVARLGSDKAMARETLAAAGLPIPRFAVVSTPAQVVEAMAELGPAVVVKSASGGYDGRGVWFLDDPTTASELVERIGTAVIEEVVSFERELSVVIARSSDGSMAVYPVIETVQGNGMCTEAVLPAGSRAEVLEEARSVAIRIAEHTGLEGLMAVELFDLGDRVLVNELAARPHNSGHLTIEACPTSQFEQHLRAVLGLPLGPTDPVVPVAVMVNVVGPADGSDPAARLPLALAVPGAHVHLYGKTARPGRKVGHVTAVGHDLELVRATAWAAAEALGVGLDPGEGHP